MIINNTGGLQLCAQIPNLNIETDQRFIQFTSVTTQLT